MVNSETILKIKEFSTDSRQSDSLEALMAYYDVNSLANITQEQAEVFLSKLESGEVRIQRILT